MADPLALGALTDRWDRVSAVATDPHTWVRICMVLIGGVLIVVGLADIARPAVAPVAAAAAKMAVI